jgi:hypothetical protein
MTEKPDRQVTLVIPVSRDLLERVPLDQRDFRVDPQVLQDQQDPLGIGEPLATRVRQAVRAIQGQPGMQVTQVVLAPPGVSALLEPPAKPDLPETLVPLVEQVKLVRPETQGLQEFKDPPVSRAIKELRERLDRQVYRDPPGTPAPPGIRDRRDRQAQRGPRVIRDRRGRKG